MRKFLLPLLLMPFFVLAQKDTSKLGTYTVFRYDNGKISSEGYMKNGQPDNYWKTYYENGLLKSEGNRKNFQLDSVWKFYNDSGQVFLEINYKQDKKNGLKITHTPTEIIKENYVNDIKEGFTTYCYPNGKTKLAIKFIKGREQGLAREFSPDSMVIAIYEYKNGYMISKEKINRYINDSLKQGKWVTFYPSGIMESEGTYKYGIKDGYFKTYFPDGTLNYVSKYINGEIQVNAPEVKNLDTKTEYYPSGQIKKKGTFKNNIPEGISRIYSPEGKIDSSKIYKDGIVIGDGIIDENGEKQGPWKEFYDSGELKGEGKYVNNQRIGSWKYFYKNGKVEQTGIFLKNEVPDGEWIWYYDNGDTLRNEIFSNGLREGTMTEYTDSGTVMTKGDYIDDLEEGLWYYHDGDMVIQGSYKSGNRDGQWKYTYDNGNTYFAGNYTDDFPDGKLTYYWSNGKVMDEGYYVMGKKEGDWFKYDENGSLFMITTFKNDIEIKYDSYKINLPVDSNGE